MNSSHLSCDTWRPWLVELADGQPLPPEAAGLAEHLAGCAACQAELTQLRRLLGDLDALPPVLPPLAMRDDFAAMLNEEKAKQAAASPLSMSRGGRAAEALPNQATNHQPSTISNKPSTWWRIAAGVALLLGASLLGWSLRGLGSVGQGPVASGRPAPTEAPAPAESSVRLAAELAAARQRPVSATERLRLVSEAPAVELTPNDPAVTALIHTLDTDPNPNVRLAACEALVRLRADPRVGPALVEALPLQTDPNVQITLIEALVTLREKRAVPQLQQLSQQPEALPAVRQQAASGLGQLI